MYKSFTYPECLNELYVAEVSQFGSMPEQLFKEPHPMRNETNKIESFNMSVNATKNSKTCFIKNILATSGASKAIELNVKTRKLNEIQLPNVCGEILCYSTLLNLIIFGTKKDPFLTVFDINNNKTKTEFHVNSIITAVFLNQGRYLVIGSKDCSIHVFDLVSMSLISSSSFHSDEISAISCCYENLLLASIDRSSTLVLETLIDHFFITSVSLDEILTKLSNIDETLGNEIESSNLISSLINKEDFVKDVNQYNEDKLKKCIESKSSPKICVFKSGVVAITFDSNLVLLDYQGKVITVKCFEDVCVELHRCYGVDTHEFLIIGVKPCRVYLFDVCFLNMIAVYETYFDSITTSTKNSCFITYYNGKIHCFDFSNLEYSKIKAVQKEPVVISSW